VEYGGLRLQPAQTASLCEETVIDVEGGPHMHQSAIVMQICQDIGGRVTAWSTSEAATALVRVFRPVQRSCCVDWNGRALHSMPSGLLRKRSIGVILTSRARKQGACQLAAARLLRTTPRAPRAPGHGGAWHGELSGRVRRC
jgi:hypothetical protein